MGVTTTDALSGDFGQGTNHPAHIIPKVEDDTWDTMRKRQFIPARAKSVQHEARNGIILCPSHHLKFDTYYFYIRWVPHVQRFVFTNHSGHPTLEQFHGRAVRLFPDDPHVPFHGAFLVHEMRVRGHFPLCLDRPVTLPIRWQSWMPEDDRVGDGDGKNDDSTFGVTSNEHTDDNHLRHSGTLVGSPGPPPKTLILTNPFANVAELEALNRDFVQQPNWTASLIEGEDWEGKRCKVAKTFGRIDIAMGQLGDDVGELYVWRWLLDIIHLESAELIVPQQNLAFLS